MNKNMIRLTLVDWQWNASIIGFINIVGPENVQLANNTVEFSPDILDGFEEKYFSYLINTYEKTLSWYKITSFIDKLNAFEESDFESFDLQELKNFNYYIKEVVKKYIKSASYKAAYELMEFEVDVLSLEKQLSRIKEPKNQQQMDADRNKIITAVKETSALLKQVIAYCNSRDGKRYIRAKNVIDTVISNAWNGISILNPQTDEKNFYKDYKVYFVDNAINYLQNNKSGYKYKCFVCNEPIKDLKNNLSFLNATGFDVGKKASHVWDFQNDIAICPLCKLVYSCLPAGITYIYDRGIYVNANINIKDALNINYKIKQDILYKQEGVRSVYYSLINALYEKENNIAKYEVADVQLVRYKHKIIKTSRGNVKVVSYRFNILSKKMLQIIVDSERELNSLLKTSFNENGQNIRIYDEVISRIFNNQNLFTLVHRMLYYKLSDSSKCYFNGMHVSNLLVINQRIYQCLGGMKMEKAWEQEQVKNDLVKNAKAAGYYLRKQYVDKGSANKLPGICYRLLNALKTSNSDMFMDVTLNCYLYVNSQVPKVMTDVLGKEKSFSTMGYAFVAGLIDGQDVNENNEKKVKGEVE